MKEMGKLGRLQVRILIWEKAEVVKVLLLKPLSRPPSGAAGSQSIDERFQGISGDT